MRPIFLLMILAFLTPTLRAEIVEQPVDYKHDGVALRGYLYYDDELSAVRPGVMVVHEWWGNNDYARSRARQLCELGYVAFAADMYGTDLTTDEPDQAKAWATPFYQNPRLFRSRAQAGLDVLAAHPLVRDRPLAAIGYCFGGTTVMQLAASNPDRLVGVVSFHGSPMPLFEDDPAPTKPAVLICNGADDPFFTRDQLTAVVDQFKARQADVMLIDYEGAQHSFTNPAADNRIEGAVYHEPADVESWQDMQDFFELIFTAPDLPAME